MYPQYPHLTLTLNNPQTSIRNPRKTSDTVRQTENNEAHLH